jgi:hypothetical protein
MPERSKLDLLRGTLDLITISARQRVRLNRGSDLLGFSAMHDK